MSNHSERVAARGNQLDYLGIVILMWGSTIPSVYYGFYCNHKLQHIYWALVSCLLRFTLVYLLIQKSDNRVSLLFGQVTTLAAACVLATFHRKFRHPTLRPYRAAMYAGLGLSAIVFIVHGLIIYGWKIQNQRMSLLWMGLMGCLNLIGAVTYACRVRSMCPQ